MTQQIIHEPDKFERGNRKAIDLAAVTRFFGYGVSLVSVVVGVAFVSGQFVPSSIPLQFRVMCGVVFLLLGIYRFVVTRFKARNQERSIQ